MTHLQVIIQPRNERKAHTEDLFSGRVVAICGHLLVVQGSHSHVTFDRRPRRSGSHHHTLHTVSTQKVDFRTHSDVIDVTSVG